eukprot:3866948-Alexandrium_andersonii.AAC.1
MEPRSHRAMEPWSHGAWGLLGLGPGAWVQLLAPGCKPAALGDLAPWSHRAMEPGAKGPVPGCSAWRLPVACGLRPGDLAPWSHGAQDLEAWSPWPGS